MSPRPPKSRNSLSQWWNARRKNDVSEQTQENLFLPYVSQARAEYEQELDEMSVEELCNNLFDEDSLAQLKSFRPTGNKEA